MAISIARFWFSAASCEARTLTWKTTPSAATESSDSLGAQAARSPFHGVLARTARYDTGNPVGFLEAAIAFALRNPEMSADVKAHLGSLTF